MQGWLRVSRGIDRASDLVGRGTAWLAVLMVLVGAYNAVGRYVGRFIGVNLSSNLYLELQWYLFSLLFLLAAAWGLKEDSHVRVDVFYARLSARTRGWINVAGLILLLIPFCAFTLWTSIPAVRNSWVVRETSPDPGGLARYPLKAVILVCFVLLLVQAVSELIKAFAMTRSPVPPPVGGRSEGEAEAEVRHEGAGGAI
jgi:TRAP-type mannitol/chloroaromatic compound transport system permease small subunit